MTSGEVPRGPVESPKPGGAFGQQTGDPQPRLISVDSAGIGDMPRAARPGQFPAVESADTDGRPAGPPRSEFRTSPKASREIARRNAHLNAVRTVTDALVNDTKIIPDKFSYLDALITLEAAMGADHRVPDTRERPKQFDNPAEPAVENPLERVKRRRALWKRAGDHWIESARPVDLGLHSRTWISLSEAVYEHLRIHQPDNIFGGKPDISKLRVLADDQLERRRDMLATRQRPDVWTPRQRDDAEKARLTADEKREHGLAPALALGKIPQQNGEDLYIYGKQHMVKADQIGDTGSVEGDFTFKLPSGTKPPEVYLSKDGSYVIDGRGMTFSKLQIYRGDVRIRKGDVALVSLMGGHAEIDGDVNQAIAQVREANPARNASLYIRGNCRELLSVRNMSMHNRYLIDGDVEHVNLGDNPVGEDTSRLDDKADIAVVRGEILTYSLSTKASIYGYGMVEGNVTSDEDNVLIGTDAQNTFERTYPSDEEFLRSAQFRK